MSHDDKDGERLLPCPFCGSGADFISNPWRADAEWWAVFCDGKGCPVDMQTSWCRTKAEAGEAWNSRAPLSAIGDTSNAAPQGCPPASQQSVSADDAGLSPAGAAPTVKECFNIAQRNNGCIRT